jgi:hypothetical protein
MLCGPWSISSSNSLVQVYYIPHQLTQRTEAVADTTADVPALITHNPALITHNPARIAAEVVRFGVVSFRT